MTYEANRTLPDELLEQMAEQALGSGKGKIFKTVECA